MLFYIERLNQADCVCILKVGIRVVSVCQIDYLYIYMLKYCLKIISIKSYLPGEKGKIYCRRHVSAGQIFCEIGIDCPISDYLRTEE